ncbi:MAG: DNA polymerase III subunit delta [Armatimonadetes bacterium]|nr:DNA polymerase III subunit delta [Armatimonadota bacterium]
MRSGVDGPTLIIGDEEYLAEQTLARLLDETLPPDDRQLNLDVLDGGAPVGELLIRLDTAPFFGPRRVVVIRRLEAMREADQEALVTYLERGDSPTTGIFIAREMDRRRRLFLTFKRVGTIIECRPIPPRDRPAWVAALFVAAGKIPGRGVAEGLVATSGGSLRDLYHEVAKLAAYVGERPQVTTADVEAIASRLGEATIFTLVDAVGGGNAGGALGALHDNLATHEPLQVLFMIVRQFRLIARAHAAAAKGRSSERLAEHLGVHPFVARKIAEQARGYRADQFAGIFDALEAADRAIKSGSAPRLVLETLIVRLAGRRAPAAQQRTASRA